MGGDSVREEGREVPVFASADVVVAGGGPGGLAAAVAAARSGASTVLIERYGFMGGMATAGLVAPILGHKVTEDQPAVEGLCREFVERMHGLGGAASWQEGMKAWGIRFDPEAFKYAADCMVQEAGVQLLLHSFVCGAARKDGGLDALIIEAKQGRLAVRGSVFVDATGDADVAFRAGLPTTTGRPFDGRPMAMGSMFRIRDVGAEFDENLDSIRKHIEEARRAGQIPVYGGPGWRTATMRDDEITPNVTRAPGDATLVEDITRAELKIRKDTWDIVKYYRENLPGFQKCHLAATPAHVGVRETRQAVGDYTMTRREILEALKHPDGIARASYWIDIHCCMGYTDVEPHVCTRDCKKAAECPIIKGAPEQLPEKLWPPTGQWAHVPYRSLVVNGADNLLESGRCISADHDAMAATRVMATCMAIGQAAGTAAALAADTCAGNVRGVDVARLRTQLEADGALV